MSEGTKIAGWLWIGAIFLTAAWATAEEDPKTWPFEKRLYTFDEKRGAYTLEPVVEPHRGVPALKGYRVLNAAKKEIQFVAHGFWGVSGRDALSVVDVDFDDHPDLMLEIDGGSAPNIYHELRLFDPETGKFFAPKDVPPITDVDTNGETLRQYGRSGPSSVATVYRWRDGKLIVVRRREEHALSRHDEEGLLERGYYSTLEFFENGVIRKRVRSERGVMKTEFPIEALIERFDDKGELVSRRVVVQEQ